MGNPQSGSGRLLTDTEERLPYLYRLSNAVWPSERPLVLGEKLGNKRRGGGADAVQGALSR